MSKDHPNGSMQSSMAHALPVARRSSRALFFMAQHRRMHQSRAQMAMWWLKVSARLYCKPWAWSIRLCRQVSFLT